MEQHVNIIFVNEVEKNATLYNYIFNGYSKNNITKKVCSQMTTEVNLTG